MKAFLVFFAFALFIMAAAAQGVHVVENNPGYVHVVDNNPGHVHVVDNNPGQISLSNPDPAFGRPSNLPNGQQYEPVNIGPTFVNPPPYPYKQYSNPYARGGK